MNARIWGSSSAGRAPPSHGGGRRFESALLHRATRERVFLRSESEDTCFDRSSIRTAFCDCSGRARRGASGALNPKSALAGPKPSVRAVLLRRALSGYAVKAGSRGV